MSEFITTHIDLLRHGECEGGEIFRGKTDVALTHVGEVAMKKSISTHKQHLKSDWDVVISSPLSRCRKFSKAYAEKMNCELEIETDFSEIDFGDWDGQPIEEVKEMFPELMKQWKSDPETFCPPGGESVSDFQYRVIEALKTTIENNKGKNLLVVSHGGVIRCLLSYALGASLKQHANLNVPFACLSRISCYEYNIEDSEEIDGQETTLQLSFHNLAAC